MFHDISLYKVKDRSLYFLFTNENYNEKKIGFPEIKTKVNRYNTNYNDNKKYSVVLFEIFGNEFKEIIILIDNSLFIMPIKAKTTNENIFLFNQKLIEVKTKKEIKLNILNINEEFDIYYNYCKEKFAEFTAPPTKIKDDLLSSALYILKTNSTFSFFLTILIKFPKLYQNDWKFCEKLLLDIKYKGDLSIIDKKELYNIKIDDSMEYTVIIDIFSIFNDIDYLRQKIDEKNYNKERLFFNLSKYKVLFYNSLDMIQSYSFLISVSDSISNIKIVLKCINNFTDFINIINENKEHIIKLIKKIDKEERKNIIIINDYFDIRKIIEEGIKENVYNSLFCIKGIEMKSDIKIFFVSDFLLFNDKNNDEILLRNFIFNYFRGLKIQTKEFFHLIKNNLQYIKKFNNYEIFAIIDILSEFGKNDNFSFILAGLIKEINYDNIDNNLIKFFSQIKFENYLDNSDYNNILDFMINNLTNIKGCELIFILLNKLDQKNYLRKKEEKKNQMILSKKNQMILSKKIKFNDLLKMISQKVMMTHQMKAIKNLLKGKKNRMN